MLNAESERLFPMCEPEGEWGLLRSVAVKDFTEMALT